MQRSITVTMKVSKATTRIVAHLDMDAFFAAVEERDNPQWRGFPIVVGADPKNGNGRGVVSTANYEARKFGIHSALPITRAWRLAQEGKKKTGKETIFLPGSHRVYSRVSRSVMDVVEKYGPTEQVSVDEAFVDLSSAGNFKKAAIVCRRIKKEIFKQEKLTCSIGLASNKLVAKIASDMQKPDGLTIVPAGDEEKFMRPLVLRKIPGIGPKTQIILERKKMKTVSDALPLTEADLYEILGEWGLELYEKLRGRSEAPVITEPEDAKSIGEQTTFDEDTLDSRVIMGALEEMGANVVRSLKKDKFDSFKRVVLTVRFDDFKTVTRSHMLPEETGSTAALNKEILKMLLPFFDKRENPQKRKIRLVGTRVEILN